MSHIVISGYYGFDNAGDEAMLAAMLEAILEVLPRARITVISGNPKETERRHGVKAIPRLSPWHVARTIKSCDLLISGGGSLLQDVTSDRSLYYYLSVIRLAKMFGKPVMLYAQGIGPIQKEISQRRAATILNTVDLITVRDEISKEELESIGVNRVPIHVTADAVLSMHPVDRTIGERLLKMYKLPSVAPKIGVSVRPWKHHVGYRKVLAGALDELVKNEQASIIFVPMQYPDDIVEAKEVAKLMKEDSIVLECAYTTTELLGLSSCMDVFIGVRLHALVFASLMEIPVVAVSYDPKINNFMHMIGDKDILRMRDLQKEELIAVVKEKIKLSTPRQEVLENIRELRERSLKNAHLAFDLLKKK